jgi:hypothetical protein
LPDDATRPTLRVFLLRQVTLEIRGAKKSWRNQILGEANLVTVPPLLATSYYSPCGDIEPQEEDHLDWEGELQVNEKYKIGGWQGAGVHVKVSSNSSVLSLSTARVLLATEAPCLYLLEILAYTKTSPPVSEGTGFCPMSDWSYMELAPERNISTRVFM